MFFTIYLIISLILFTTKLISILKDKCDNTISFYIISIIILSFTLYIFLLYYSNLPFSLIISLLLMITTFIFIIELKNNYKYEVNYLIPFFILTIYLFAKIINSFLFLAHQ